VAKSVQTSLSKEHWLLLRDEAARRDVSLYELVREILLIHIFKEKENKNGRERNDRSTEEKQET